MCNNVCTTISVDNAVIVGYNNLEYTKIRICKYVIRTNKMHNFFINDLIQQYCLRHVSTNQVFIIRKTVQAAL